MKVGSTGAYVGTLRAAEGMHRNAKGISDVADSVAAAAASSVREPVDEPGPAVVRVQPSERDLDDALVDLKRNEIGYKANAQVVRTSDEAFESLLDMVIPSGSGE